MQHEETGGLPSVTIVQENGWEMLLSQGQYN